MPTEAQKIRQAYRDGVRYGASAGIILALEKAVEVLADKPEAAELIKQIDSSKIKVPS